MSGAGRSERVGGSGAIGLVAALCVSIGLAFQLLYDLLGAEAYGWPWADPGVINLLLGIVALACTVAATVDSWLALAGTARRSSRSYLRAGGVLLVVACLSAGPVLAIWLLPGLVLTWVAYSKAGTGPLEHGVRA